MTRLRQGIAMVAIAASLITVKVGRAQAQEQQQGWCNVACGLGTAACCLFAAELCEICGLGTEPCVLWCTSHYPGGR